MAQLALGTHSKLFLDWGLRSGLVVCSLSVSNIAVIVGLSATNLRNIGRRRKAPNHRRWTVPINGHLFTAQELEASQQLIYDPEKV